MLPGDSRWFEVLVETEHVTDAAAILDIDQSTLSKRLARLEEKIGVVLFDRDGRSLHVNSRGRALARALRRAEDALSEGLAEVRRLMDPELGTVRFGFMHSLGPWLVPRILHNFLADHPKASLEIFQSDSDELLRRVGEGQLDVVLCSTDHLDVAQGLHVEVVRRQHMSLVVPRGHRLAGRQRVSFAEVATEAFVSAPPRFTTRTLLEEAARAQGVRPRIIATSDVLATQAGLASAGVGLAVLPADDPSLRVTGAVFLDLVEDLSRDMSLAWSVSAGELPIVGAFLDIARQTLAFLDAGE